MTTYTAPGVYPKESDFSFYVRQLSTSTAGFVGVTERGPINHPTPVYSWPQFTEKFGSYLANSDLAYAARAFFDNGGGNLVVNRVVHYTDITDRASTTARVASITLRDRRAVRATATTGSSGTDQITWSAVANGSAGNAVEIEAVAAGTNTQLSIALVGSMATVHLGTDTEGNPTSTVLDLQAILTNEPNSPITMTSTDTGVITPFVAQRLSGGADGNETMQVQANSPGDWGNQLEIQIDDQDNGFFRIRVIENGNTVESWPNLTMNESDPRHAELVVNPRSKFIQIDDLRNDSALPLDRPEPGLYVLSGGTDGLDGLNSQDFIGDPATKTGLNAFGETKLNMLAAPGISSVPVIQAGIQIAELRRNLVFLVDPPSLLEPAEMVDFKRGRNLYNHGALVTNYGAVYYPWMVVQDPVTTAERLVPPSAYAAACYARTDRVKAVWYAPAGEKRGRLFGVLRANYPMAGAGELGALYSEGVNPIAQFDKASNVIWGQRTMAGLSSALDRVNVRRLLIYLQESISQATRFVVFEPNDPLTWNAIKRVVNPFLAHIQKERGLAAFRVQCDEDTNPPILIDNHQVGVRVFVIPIKSAEMIEIDFALAATGADFTEIYGANR